MHPSIHPSILEFNQRHTIGCHLLPDALAGGKQCCCQKPFKVRRLFKASSSSTLVSVNLVSQGTRERESVKNQAHLIVFIYLFIYGRFSGMLTHIGFPLEIPGGTMDTWVHGCCSFTYVGTYDGGWNCRAGQQKKMSLLLNTEYHWIDHYLTNIPFSGVKRNICLRWTSPGLEGAGVSLMHGTTCT